MLKRIFFKEHYSSIATEEQLLFSFFYLILFFNFTILYWFCHISTWIRHRHTRNMYNIIYETSRQSRFDAQYWMLGAGALGWPRRMVRGGRKEEGSGQRTRVYLWQIHVDIWQNQLLFWIVQFLNCIQNRYAHFFWAPYTWVSQQCSPTSIWTDGFLLSFKVSLLGNFTTEGKSLLWWGGSSYLKSLLSASLLPPCWQWRPLITNKHRREKVLKPLPTF